jgi:hypothetical protein
VATIPIALRAIDHLQPGGRAGALIAHQTEGLSDPLNPESSTLLVHLTLVRDGLLHALREPAGVGLAQVTNAGSRLGEADALGRDTEADISNAAVAMGIPGLIVYLVVFVAGMRRAYEAARMRNVLAIAALGILTATMLQWLNGGLYAVAVLPWLVLGWLDRPSRERREDRPTDRPLEVVT